MDTQHIATAIALALLLSPFLLVFFIVKFVRKRRRRRFVEDQLAERASVHPARRAEPILSAQPPIERPKPVPAQPVRQYRFVALDVETANGGRDSICQLGLAFVTPEGTIETTSTLVNPRQPFTNTAIHGISARDVAHVPLWPATFRTFSPAISRQPVIQHSGFDRSAVKSACEAHNLAVPDWRWFDSVQIARRAWPELIGNGGHGLGNLKRHLSIEFEHHHAEEDARAAAMVVLRAEKATGLDFATLLKGPARSVARASRVRGPLSNDERSSLADLIECLATAPVLQSREAEALRAANERHYRTLFHDALEAARDLPQREEWPILTPYFRASDPKAALRAIHDDLPEQVRIVRSLFENWQATGRMAPPGYAWRITVILRKAKEFDTESAFLRAYCRHFGDQSTTKDAQMVERARKVGAVP